MWRSAPLAARVAFLLMAAFGTLGVVWVVAERVTDPGGPTGWLITATLVAAVMLLGLVAFRAPDTGRVLLIVGVAAVVAFALLDAFVGLLPEDAGPVAAVAALALVLPLAVLGLSEWRTAGWLLVVTGVGLLVGRFADQIAGASGESGGFRATLGGSSGAVAFPIILGGLLFLTARRAAR